MVTLDLALMVLDTTAAPREVVKNRISLSLPADASNPDDLEWIANEHLAKFVQDASDILVGRTVAALKTPEPETNPDNVIEGEEVQ